MSRPFVIGLTGSIGMGKTTTARMFAEAGVPVWDADAAVHRLYARGGAAVAPVSAAFPGVQAEGAIDRERLKSALAADPSGFARLERIVHPLVAEDRERFIAKAAAPVVVVDVPLLFETGAESGVDLAVVVSTSEAEQRRRVLARPGMTDDAFRQILSRQMPDAEKRRRADMVIDTGSLEAAREGVHSVIRQATGKAGNAGNRT